MSLLLKGAYLLGYVQINDFYRINDPIELYEIGIEDYLYSNGVSFIEWPSKAGDLLPTKSIEVKINFKNSYRKVSIKWTM